MATCKKTKLWYNAKLSRMGNKRSTVLTNTGRQKAEGTKVANIGFGRIFPDRST
ncbi:hypothetical protein [Scytonema hofmannii]|uniref:hypothetical protein n=1 Tax=Scytonema hofmannii TaxID=34078 RepID=UPI0013146A70|nr:hypothetical protein [Scytonema hofmannii]